MKTTKKPKKLKRPTKLSPNRPKAIPVPEPARSSYSFESMKVGEAFVVSNIRENSVRSGASRYGKKLGRKFSVRRLDSKEAEAFRKRGDGWVGCWRLADTVDSNT